MPKLTESVLEGNPMIRVQLCDDHPILRKAGGRRSGNMHRRDFAPQPQDREPLPRPDAGKDGFQE